ncbi:MAG: hypothetical protein QXF26_07695, partial [Candidatus Bathyarchaeia archaeon]
MLKVAGVGNRTGAAVDLDIEGVAVEEMVPEEAAPDSTDASSTVDGRAVAGRTVVDKHMPPAGILLDSKRPSLEDILDTL